MLNYYWLVRIVVNEDLWLWIVLLSKSYIWILSVSLSIFDQFIQSETLTLNRHPHKWMIALMSFGLIGLWTKYQVLQKKVTIVWLKIMENLIKILIPLYYNFLINLTCIGIYINKYILSQNFKTLVSWILSLIKC
jgi:hypothetical protein